MAAASRGEIKGTKKRIAVLFVHGQGDQRPMDDLMELAFSTWESNEAASKGAQLATIWNRPVEDSDFTEQRCLTGLDNPEVKVDYHQYYWAHLMSGNRLAHFWLWLTDLIAKNKEDVPPVFHPLRSLAIGMKRLTTILAIAYAFLSALLLYWWASDDSKIVTAIRWPSLLAAIFFTVAICFLAAKLLAIEPRLRFESHIAFLFASMSFWALAYALHLYPPDLYPPVDLDVAFGVADFEAEASWGDCPNVVLQVLRGISIGSGGINISIQQREVGSCVAFANSAITILVIALSALVALVALLGATNFLVPVMADSARYFRVRPENINNREKIRAKGVKMLKMLHESVPHYDRIIVVGHSLGTSVAYGMLDQYWGSICTKFPVSKRQVAPLLKMTKSLQQSVALGRVSDRIADWRREQRRLFNELFGASNGGCTPSHTACSAHAWRISDFITLGSPLTYAPFLLSETYKDYEAHLRKHRRYASCPPQCDVIGKKLRIRENYIDPRKNKRLKVLPHSGAFAVTRWTNLYFRTKGYLNGDIIGGPVAPIHGPGILDIELDPAETKKQFAHNEYWKWPANEKDGVASRGQNKFAYDKPPAYLVALRYAINLFDDDAEEQELVKMSKRL